VKQERITSLRDLNQPRERGRQPALPGDGRDLMRYLTMAGAALAAALFVAACDDVDDDAPLTPPAEPQQTPEAQPDPQTPRPAD
jgi:hypothetical protein